VDIFIEGYAVNHGCRASCLSKDIRSPKNIRILDLAVTRRSFSNPKWWKEGTGRESHLSLLFLDVSLLFHFRSSFDEKITHIDPYFHPIVSAWISENTFDVKKRAITAATYNVIVQIGSVISSQIYRAYDAPYYHRGNSVLIAICALSIVTFVVQRQYLIFLNKRKEKVWSVMSVEEKTAYQNDKEERERDGNKRLDFRFKY